MARQREVRAELDALKDDLVRSERARRTAAADAAAHPHPDRNADHAGFDLQHLLDEMQSHLGAAAEETEELMSAHPVAAVASAFMLGLLIGRYTRRA
jgi:ElaB/YqjD/DUF883 family membrane-anchored ribosome-binding protein